MACPVRISGRRWSSSWAPTQGLSAATITRLTTQWQDEARAFNARSLAGSDYVYIWADGIHLKVRLEADKVCLLVIIGVRADGRKELVALADGFREASESWADLLRDAKRRGMAAPVLAVGDGALGFWKAVRDVFPETREQRCWWHKIGNVLAALPQSAQPAAKKALAEIYNAEDKTHAHTAAKAFAAEFGAKWPKATAKITDDLDVLLAFYDYPAEHWIHLRTTNPIESTLRHRPAPTTGSPRAPAAAPPAWRWPSNSSNQPSNGGGWSTHLTWSPSSAPAPSSSTANSSNDPTTKINKEVISKQRKTRRSTGLDYSSP